MKLAFIILLSFLVISCNNNVQSSKAEIDSSAIKDTCNPIKLSKNLYMDFRDNMTYKQFKEIRSKLLQEKKINSDTSVSIFLPYTKEEPLELKMRVTSTHDDCYIHEINLVAFPENESNNPISYSSIIKLFENKYGKPYESGYKNVVLEDGSEIDGALGIELALSQVKVGQSIIGFNRIENGYTKGLAIWKSNGVRITVRYGYYYVYVDYRSLKYLNDKKTQELDRITKKDSANKIKINNSKKSI